jgi:hypothetical protein
MGMRTSRYPIYYNGPVVLSFLLLAFLILPRCGRSQRLASFGAWVICAACLTAVFLPVSIMEAKAKAYVPLATERGTVRVPPNLAENYGAAIRFMKEKAALGESVLSVPEDTSLYFLSGTRCPIRVFAFTPGVLAPGKMTSDLIREIDEKRVRYLLWSNRIFPEYGTPVFGKDFDIEVGDYLKSHYRPVGQLLPSVRTASGWTAEVWERTPENRMR